VRYSNPTENLAGNYTLDTATCSANGLSCLWWGV